MFYRATPDGALIVSEPLDAAPDLWTPVEAGRVIVIENGAVANAPFDRARAAA